MAQPHPKSQTAAGEIQQEVHDAETTMTGGERPQGGKGEAAGPLTPNVNAQQQGDDDQRWSAVAGRGRASAGASRPQGRGFPYGTVRPGQE